MGVVRSNFLSPNNFTGICCCCGPVTAEQHDYNNWGEPHQSVVGSPRTDRCHGAATVEIRNTVKVVDACIEAFVRPKMSKRVSDDKETGGEQKGCQAIGGEVNVQGSEPQLAQGVDFSGGPESDETSTFSAQRGSPFLHMLLGGFADDTLMMGSMLNIPDIPIMQPPVFPSQDSVASGGDSQRLTEVPPHSHGKMQVRLGGDTDVQLTPLEGGSKPSKIPRIIDLTPEEKKRSGKMRKAQREPKWDIGGTPKKAITFPSFIRCKFKLTPQHKYGFEEVQTLAFIFGDSPNPNDVLFRRGTHKMDREDFACLLPGNELSDYVLELMAYRTAWTQFQLEQKTLWSLPVHFSEMIINADVTMDRLISLYKPNWLPRPTHLKYIYIQMKEILQHSKETHLYLMVVDKPNGKIWLFDSFATNDAAKERILAVKAVSPTVGFLGQKPNASALDRILKKCFADLDVLGKRPPLHRWELEFLLGLPNMGNV
ncbi:hypothetical protein PIB30_002928 [Stylosanthes scabra]|uniref:Uncharacterized protein n=1 Tax=Stylosanthes scabra TaxID=79078 RepID=A0ABU6V1F5_9FABA|nr:hypothetical protein [Stylosanthes scabra]